jgi:glycosyltransferase involved in cell wall biosynthesis
MSLKVLHVITSLGNGGAEAVLYRLTTGDDKNTHQVISLMNSGVYGTQLLDAGIPIHILDMPRGWMTLKGLFKLYQLFQTTNPDVVQTWMYHADLIGGVVARLSRKRSVVWGVRASDAHIHTKNIASSLVFWLSARLSKNIPARIIFNSKAGERVHKGVGYPSGKSIVISNGYNTNELIPDSVKRERLRAEWGFHRKEVLIGMVGRWDPLKDHEVLIAALNHLKGLINQNWSCVLIGTDMTDANAELVALLDRYCMTNKVALCGPCGDITAVMNALDIHVLSSKSEAFPNVVAEAMACGTPCVVTDVGDANLIVEDTGWVVPSSDPLALARALKEAIGEMEDTAKWQKRKETCRFRILGTYSLDRMVDGYNKVWMDVSNA